MKVKELIEALSKVDPDMKVIHGRYSDYCEVSGIEEMEGYTNASGWVTTHKHPGSGTKEKFIYLEDLDF